MHESLEIPTTPELKEVLQSFPQSYFIGGCVRDALLGLPPKDLDIEVHGQEFEEIKGILEKHGRVDLTGVSFQVIKAKLADGETYDFSLPRKDQKTGEGGHQGFLTNAFPHMGIKEACRRRDFTVNAIAVHTHTKKIEDPFNGINDLQNGILRAVDHQTFAEDPLRVLRGFQFYSRFGFQMDDDTLALCQSLLPEFETLAPKRVWDEWEKWATKSQVPSAGIRALIQTGWIQKFPELMGLEEIPQDPNHHPEGNVLNHTLHCLDAMAVLPAWKNADATLKTVFMLSILCHDLGKKTHTTMEVATRKVKSIGHEAAGVEPTNAFLKRIGAPQKLHKPIAALVENHMAYLVIQEEQQPETKSVRAKAMILADKLAEGQTTIETLMTVILADHSGRPPLPGKLPKRAQTLLEAAELMGVTTKKPLCPISGKDLALLGLEPGPIMGKILRELKKRYLNLAFVDSREKAIQYYIDNIIDIQKSAEVDSPPWIRFQTALQAAQNDKPLATKAYRSTYRKQLLGALKTPQEAQAFLHDFLKKERPQPDLA